MPLAYFQLIRQFEELFLAPDSPQQRRRLEEERQEWQRFLNSQEPARVEQERRVAYICSSRDCGCQFKNDSAPRCIFRTPLKPKKNKKTTDPESERTLEVVEAELNAIAEKKQKLGFFGQAAFNQLPYEQALQKEKDSIENDIKAQLEMVRKLTANIVKEFEIPKAGELWSTASIVPSPEGKTMEEIYGPVVHF